MKYIRTKDEILESNGLIQSNSTIEENAILVCGGHFAIPMSLIIKQADTIEELCDQFVMFTNCSKRKIRVCQTMRSISLYFKRDKRWNGNMVDKVYGAIWTEWGLKYVAKMNNEGDLELL